jgi:hypothetical protein
MYSEPYFPLFSNNFESISPFDFEAGDLGGLDKNYLIPSLYDQLEDKSP